nr:EamA family transporter [Pseudomonas luteola]
MLLSVAIVWGTSYGVAKEALYFYPVLGFLSVRFLITFVLLAPTLRGNFYVACITGIPLGVILFFIFICETYGVSMTSASNAAFLISLCIVFTPFVEWILFQRKPENIAFYAAGLSLLGAFLLTGANDIKLNQGDCLMVAAAVLRAFMVCFTKKITEKHNVPALALTAVQTGIVGLGSMIFFIMSTSQLPLLPSDFSFWAAISYLVILATLFAFFAQNYAIQRTTPSRASLLMGSEPLFGAIFACLWLNEKLDAMAWFGGVLIVVASLWATRPRNVHTPKVLAPLS